MAKGHIDFKTDPWPNVSSEAKDAVRVMLQQASPGAAYNAGGDIMLSASRLDSICMNNSCGQAAAGSCLYLRCFLVDGWSAFLRA